MALGELLAEAKGKVIGVRVLPDGKIENTFQGSGKILGTDMNDIGTFWVQARPDGSFYGEGQVVLMAKEGSAMYKGSGVGKPTGRSPAAKILFGAAFQSVPQAWARLLGVYIVGEHEQDENGNYNYKIWEWKFRG